MEAGDAQVLHEHGHQHGHIDDDLTGKFADAYDSWPFYAEVTGAIGRAFLKEYDFSKERTHVLDFACGTGMYILTFVRVFLIPRSE